MQSGRNDPEEEDAVSRERPGGLLQRILHKFRPAALPAASDEAALQQDSLLPPGRRSGNGTGSLEPYLDQYRHSRPSRLE
jgi:hypothetical protein